MALRVLVVEDNATNQMLIRAVLQRDGFEVSVAGSAEEAAQAIAQRLPDLILMDVHLPGEDGLSLTRRLRAESATATLPIVAVTALAMPGDGDRVLAAGCTGYITKPIDTRRLAEQVRSFLTTV